MTLQITSLKSACDPEKIFSQQEAITCALEGNPEQKF
jgi:hypothetical protein